MKHAYILHSSLNGGNSQRLNFEPLIDEITFARFDADMLSEEEVKQLPQKPPMHLEHPFDVDLVPEMFGTKVGAKFITQK